MVGGCCVCSDERGWTENPLVYCDGQGCNVAVHQGLCRNRPLSCTKWFNQFVYTCGRCFTKNGRASYFFTFVTEWLTVLRNWLGGGVTGVLHEGQLTKVNMKL